MKKLQLLVLVLLSLSLLNCATSQIPSDPVCERKEFGNSWICSQFRASGIQYIEDLNDLILDANDISLILEFYSAKDLKKVLDSLEIASKNVQMDYTTFISLALKETSKASRIGSIIKRRAGILKSPEIMRESDRKLIQMAINSLRQSSGI